MLNPFFLQGSSGEQNLVQDLINEQLKIYGVEVYYLPRQYATTNTVIREVIQSKFENAYPLEAYVESYNGYGGQGTILSKFGIQELDDLTLIISKERFETYITPFLAGLEDIKTPFRPKEGDLIYFPLGDRIFEIKYVEHEKPFYQLKKNYTYELQCELFRFSEEIIDTDIEFIDDSSEDIGVITTLKMIGGGTEASAFTNIVNGGVRFVNVLNRGNGYKTAPIVKFSKSSGGTTAAGIATMLSGVVDICEPNPNLSRVQGVELTNPGSGYTEAPMITFTSDSGSGAAATCTIGNGVVGIITISNSGSGYVFEPRVSFVGVSSVSAVARAIVEGGEVTQIRIIDAGVGYTSTPQISIDPPGPVAVAATAIITNNSVTSIDVTNTGYGYTSAPTVTISTPDLDPETAVASPTSVPLGQNYASFTTTNAGRYYLTDSVATTEYVGLDTNRSSLTKFTLSPARYSYNYAVGTPDETFSSSNTQSTKGGFWIMVSPEVDREIDDLIIFSDPGPVFHYYGGQFYNDSFKFAFGISSNGKAQIKIDNGPGIENANSIDLRDGLWHWVYFTTDASNTITFRVDNGPSVAYGAGNTKALYGIGGGFKFSNIGMTSNEHRIRVNEVHIANYLTNNITPTVPSTTQVYDSSYSKVLTANYYSVSYIQNGVDTFISTVTSVATKYGSSGNVRVEDTEFLDHEIVSISSISVLPPTGTAVDFTAEASTSIGVGGTVAVTLTDGGGGYSVAPILTFSDPLSVGTYVFNEIIRGEASGTTARVKSWNSVSKYLEVTNLDGVFQFQERIVGQESGAVYLLYEQIDYNIEDSQDETDRGEQFAQNNEIEIEADAIIDFSETNPFGTP